MTLAETLQMARYRVACSRIVAQLITRQHFDISQSTWQHGDSAPFDVFSLATKRQDDKAITCLRQRGAQVSDL